MNKVIAGLIAGLAGAAVLVLVVTLGTLMGALSGWIIGWFFSETILGFFTALGVTGLKMWQIGASLGFIGGFFRTSVSSS